MSRTSVSLMLEVEEENFTAEFDFSTVLEKSNSAVKFSSSTSSMRLTDVLDIVNGKLTSYRFANHAMTIGLLASPESKLAIKILIPHDLFKGDQFKVDTDLVDGGYNWDPINKLLTVSGFAQPNGT